MISVLKALVLEVSVAQIPSLRLLSICPHGHADSNPYSQGPQLLPSLLEDLAFLVPPGRQRRSAQEGAGQEARPSVLEIWARILGREKDLQRDSIQAPELFWPRACLCSGSLPQVPRAVSPWPDLGLELCLCSQLLKAELVWGSRPRGTGRPSMEAL